MGKKEKWLTSVKSALQEGDDGAEPELKETDIFGDIRPLAVQLEKQEKPKQKGRRWSLGKLAPAEEKEPEKRRDESHRRESSAVMFNSKFAKYMYPSQEEWAAVGIQTAFRGYVARKSLRALRGLSSDGGHRVSRTMQALVQGRIRMSEENLAAQHQMWHRPSRKAADGLSEAGWISSTLSAQQLEAKVPERQVAALKRARALAYARSQQRRRMPLSLECEVEKASYMERWLSARPWESCILDSPSAWKDVAAASKSVDVSMTRNAKDTSSRCASLQAVMPTSQARAGSELHVCARSGPWNNQSRTASPQRRDAEEAGLGTASGTARMASILTDPQFGTRYSNSGPVRNGVIMYTEGKSPPLVAGHLQAMQSVKNKACSSS